MKGSLSDYDGYFADLYDVYTAVIAQDLNDGEQISIEQVAEEAQISEELATAFISENGLIQSAVEQRPDGTYFLRNDGNKRLTSARGKLTPFPRFGREYDTKHGADAAKRLKDPAEIARRASGRQADDIGPTPVMG